MLDGLGNPLKGLPAHEAAQLVRWGREQSRIMQSNPLLYGLPPHQGQMKVHVATDKEVLLIAANRWGKSVCGMRETLMRATGLHPYKQIRPHDVIWCGFKEYGFYNKVTKRLFNDWVPKNHLIQFHDSEKWATFRRKDGGVCTVYFLSYEMGRESWQGGAVDFIWLDEELPFDIYKEASARLIDRRGDMLMTQTPVSGLGWAYDEIYIPARAQQRNTLIVQGALATKDETKPYKIGEPLVPHMDRDQIIRFAKIVKDPDERDIRIFGEFRGRSGGVYRVFDPTIHVIPPFEIPKYFEIWGGVDPGFHGFAATLFAMDPMGRVYIVGEFFSQQENQTARAKRLWELVQRTFKMDEDDWLPFYCDTANPQDILELNTWAQEAGARIAFAPLRQGLKAREAGVQRVNEYLQPVPERTKPPHVDRATPEAGEPMIYFFDTLHSDWQSEEEGFSTSRLLWEMRRYLWKRPKQGSSEPSGADEDSAGGAHALASLRYGMMARMGAPEEPESDEEGTAMDRMLKRHMEQLERELQASGRA